MSIIKAPKILLPDGVDLKYWAVVACDQFTSEKSYWKELESLVSTRPSTLNLILPEVYLKDNFEKRIENINNTMERYLNSGIFKDEIENFILIERSTPYQKKRLGLMISIDLEEYCYQPNSRPLIRATEGTILDRLPPRVKIRENALLELPHIMLLADDKEKTIIEKIYENKDQLEVLYDFELNMNGGHIKGYRVENTNETIKDIMSLLDADVLVEKYGKNEQFLFAVGDGNHSLATAKMCYENLKKSIGSSAKNHPSRYALCELVNLYDEGLEFEPIHRYIENIDANHFISKLNLNGNAISKAFVDGIELEINLPKSVADAIKQLDVFIEEYIKEFGGYVDYVHGENSLKELTISNKQSVGIMLPKMEKQELFASVIKNGSLPRKTFSMGEAVEKRYYIESRKIQ